MPNSKFIKRRTISEQKHTSNNLCVNACLIVFEYKHQNIFVWIHSHLLDRSQSEERKKNSAIILQHFLCVLLPVEYF